MTRVRVSGFSMSLDGFGAGPRQDLQNPLGVGGTALHEWLFGTKTFQKSHGDFAAHLIGDQPERVDHDDRFAARALENVGAWIMGRNMFAPSRGPWVDDGWKGWWGTTPPFHSAVFVLTHHARPSLTMDGGTTFHFVTEGPTVALARAREAAQGRDVRIGGGANVIRQYLSAKAIDELHLAVSPVLLGSGEPLLAGIDLTALGYRVSEHVATARATHVVLSR